MTVAVAVELAPATRAGLTDGEFGSLALRDLTFRSWQRGTNQPTVDRSLVLWYRCVGGGFRFDLGGRFRPGSEFQWLGHFKLFFLHA
jgi:hypothetical protein